MSYLLVFEDDYNCLVNTDFNPSVADPQCVYADIVASDYRPGQKLTSITIGPSFNYNCNTVLFDNIQVCIDDYGAIYGHDVWSGNLNKAVNRAGNQTTFVNDAHNEITQINKKIGEDLQGVAINSTTSNTYDSSYPHRLITSTSPIDETRGVKTEFTYDSYGNATNSKVQDSSAQGKSIESSTAYSATGNFPVSSTDSRGNTTAFSYNEDNGNLEEIIAPNSEATGFTYDNAGRMLTATSGETQSTYSYTNGVLSGILHKNSANTATSYNFARDIFGKVTQSKVGNYVLSTNVYDGGNGPLKKVKYANNQLVKYDYDQLGRLTRKHHCNGRKHQKGAFEYGYDNRNRLVKAFDPFNNRVTKFEYDLYGRITHTRRSDGVSADYTFDKFRGFISKAVLKMFGSSQIINNTFAVSDNLESSEIKLGSNDSVWSRYVYDDLGRLDSTETETNGSGVKHKIIYHDIQSTDNTTNLAQSFEAMKKDGTSLGKKFSYEYDNMGNITSIKDSSDGVIISYEYDNLGQLTRENNNNLGKTITYTYDFGGNIQKKEIYAYTSGDLSALTPENTVVYGYEDSNWKDKMTSYNGQKIIYDGIGNPLKYRDGWNFEWRDGRRLDKALNQNYNITYKYDDAGTRTSKTVNGVTTDFVTNGISVLAQKTGDDLIVWQIDANGSVVGFNYNGTQYFYLKNAQGDVIGIADTSGNIKAEYVYDSWGKVVSVTNAPGTNIGDVNLIRYRGYYYDSETGLYYLNARYYDPETGRFINADDNLAGGLNLFAYCYNNPVNFADYDGRDAIIANQKANIVGLGHMSAFVQDASNNWHFFYWGKDSVSLTQVGDASILDTTASINKWLRDKKLLVEKDPDYDGFCYIAGNFSAAKIYYEEKASEFDKDVLNNKKGWFGFRNRNYNVLTRNCGHETMYGLMRGIVRYARGNRQTVRRKFLRYNRIRHGVPYIITATPNLNLEHMQEVFCSYSHKR